ncbi:MAG: hypothetical protein EZS28_012412 [Streblomastix strix]|uniref:Uncharacterized protein n=1 Tax=Streblomastix strix TaxID=222440 RepID=A0A5J4WBX6_9EUKA|nr:MAG: hypothetical protein EZS28_012412 [Streblomastix strix]
MFMSMRNFLVDNFITVTPGKSIILEQFEFSEIRGLVSDVQIKQGPEEKAALRKLISHMEQHEGVCLEINELTNLQTILHDIQEYDNDAEMKGLLDRSLQLLNKHQLPIPPDAVSLIDHFRPIFLKDERLQRLENSNIVKARSSNWNICPFDPVITVPGAQIRPITLEKINKQVVKKDLLIPQFTDEAGIVYCEMIFSNAKLPESNFMSFRGISYESSGALWINGHWIDATDDKDKFERGSHIAMEVNMNVVPRTLRFFVEGRQIVRYVTNIPARIRFFATLVMQYDSFCVQQLCKLNKPIGILREGDQEILAFDDLFNYDTSVESSVNLLCSENEYTIHNQLSNLQDFFSTSQLRDKLIQGIEQIEEKGGFEDCSDQN